MTSPDGPRRRVGLTGARGVLGRSLQEFRPDIEWVPFGGDIRKESDVRAWMEHSLPLDAVVHLAALVPIHLVDADPPNAVRINVEGTCNVLEALRTGIEPEARPWTFVASTSHVYASSDRPLSESSPVGPLTLYGLTKLQAENWASAYENTFAMRVCIGRIFSYTSRWQALSYFVPALVRKISEAPPDGVLEIPGLLGSRDFLTTRQVTTAIMALFDQRATGIFNIGSAAHTACSTSRPCFRSDSAALMCASSRSTRAHTI
jgi:nucleoside-diphosphate-sugar epimerase